MAGEFVKTKFGYVAVFVDAKDSDMGFRQIETGNGGINW